MSHAVTGDEESLPESVLHAVETAVSQNPDADHAMKLYAGESAIQHAFHDDAFTGAVAVIGHIFHPAETAQGETFSAGNCRTYLIERLREELPDDYEVHPIDASRTAIFPRGTER